MNIFVKVVAIATAVVAALALWAQSPIRAILLLVIAVGLWIAQSKPLQRPGVLVAAAVAALLVIAANFFGPYSLPLGDPVSAQP